MAVATRNGLLIFVAFIAGVVALGALLSVVAEALKPQLYGL